MSAVEDAAGRWARVVHPGDPEHRGTRLSSWSASETWCVACVRSKGLATAWLGSPACHGCGRAVDDDTRRIHLSEFPRLSDAEGLTVGIPIATDALVVFAALCPECSVEINTLTERIAK